MLEQYAERIIAALFGLWLAVLTFWGKRELGRLDGKADKDEIKALLASLREHIDDDKQLRRDLTERLDDINGTLTTTREHVAKISGKLGI